jgi:hypothetical protein
MKILYIVIYIFYRISLYLGESSVLQVRDNVRGRIQEPRAREGLGAGAPREEGDLCGTGEDRGWRA